MKMLLATALIALAPGLALAQSQTAPAKPKASPKATVAKKPVAKSSSKTVVAKAEPTSSRVQLKSAATQVAAGLTAARAALTTEELAIAERVHVGQIPCELGYTRMWSIHPAQIRPILEALSPGQDEVLDASKIIAAAADADWAPISFEGVLHDRASYRYFWQVLERAHQTGRPLPPVVQHWFASPCT